MSKLPSDKLDVKLIALDLDDTLLNADARIDDYNVEVLRMAVEKGIYVVLCSGRAEDGILPFVRRLDVAGKQAGRFLIAINGCSVYDMHKRQQIYVRSVDKSVLLEADAEAEKIGLRSEVYSPDTIFYREETSWTRKDVDLCHVKGEVIENYTEFLQARKFPKMLIPGEPETLQALQSKLRNQMGDRAVIFTSKPYFLEILPPDCGKGEAVLWLARYIGIDPARTMCFGDSMNDEDMIVKCGYGVAMCNGLDYIKNVADFVTEKDNNSSGVGDFIARYVL